MNQITIIGLGLIGGSLGLALSNSKKIPQVVGYDIGLSSIQEAVAKGAVHWGTTGLKLAVEHADAVLLAVPVGQMKKIVQNILPFLKNHCIIFDVGSTKNDLLQELSPMIPPKIYLIGGHPMAGSERAGISGAHPYLFENAIFVLTPQGHSNEQALKTVVELVELVGAKVKMMSPEVHDQIVAGVSHLPYLVAVSLVNTVHELSEELVDAPLLAAGGFRDTTRIAGGDPVMWRDISLSNRDNIIKMIDSFEKHLAEIKNTLEIRDENNLIHTFTQAQKNREQIPITYRGALPEVYELLVTVPDQPGMLSIITGSLGNRSVNISEIEVLQVRENQEGTIRLAFQKKSDLDCALDILLKQGIPVKRR